MALVWLRVQEGTQAALRPWSLTLHRRRVCTCCCTQWRGRGHALPQALSKGLSRPRHPPLRHWGQESMSSVRLSPALWCLLPHPGTMLVTVAIPPQPITCSPRSHSEPCEPDLYGLSPKPCAGCFLLGLFNRRHQKASERVRGWVFPSRPLSALWQQLTPER